MNALHSLSELTTANQLKRAQIVVEMLRGRLESDFSDLSLVDFEKLMSKVVDAIASAQALGAFLRLFLMHLSTHFKL